MAGATGPALREALSQALTSEGDRLYALALRVTRDRDLAADAVQEAFASALARADGFRGDSAVSTWLYRIVYNKAVDALRRRGREAPLENEETSRDDDRLGYSPSWGRPPDELLGSRETSQALEEAAAALTPTQRAVFELKIVEGRTTPDVAGMLGLSEGTVRVHLHRARLKLRERLAGHFSGGRP